MIENTRSVPISLASASARTILFLDHTATLSGGELALLEMVQRLDRSLYHPVVVLSSDGALHSRLEQAGIETHVLPLAPKIVQTRKDSLGKKSLLQVGTLLRLLRYALKLAAFAKRRGADLIH